MLENPLAVGGLAVGLAAIAGFGGWAVVQSIGPQGVPEPTITSLPPLGSTATPTPTPTPIQVTPKPVEYEQPQLRLEPGVTKSVEGNMRDGDTVNYPLVAEAGQILDVAVENEGVLLSVLDASGERIARNAERVARWEGEIPESGEYRIQLRPVPGEPDRDYQLRVTLSSPPEPEPVDPTPTEPIEPVEPIEPPVDPEPVEPEPPVQPDIQTQRVSFPTGANSVLVANNVGPGQVRRYSVNAREGQILTVIVLDGAVAFDVLMPGGEMVADAAGLQRWEGFLPVGGDYSVDVVAPEFSEFTLEIRATDIN